MYRVYSGFLAAAQSISGWEVWRGDLTHPRSLEADTGGAPTGAQHTHIPGLEARLRGFGAIVEEVRRKPYDMLDAAKNWFDRDFLEFNVHINDLELAVQARP